MGFDKYSSTHTVTAEQITEERSVITPNGPVSAAPGQWEVRHPDGNVQVVDDDQFNAAFGTGKGEEVQGEQSEEKEAVETSDSEEKSEEKEAVETTSESKPEGKTVKPPTRPK